MYKTKIWEKTFHSRRVVLHPHAFDMYNLFYTQICLNMYTILGISKNIIIRINKCNFYVIILFPKVILLHKDKTNMIIRANNYVILS